MSFYGPAYHTTSATKMLTEKAVMCMWESERTSLCTSAKLKCFIFGTITPQNRLCLEPPTVRRRKRYASVIFCRCCLEGKRYHKSEGTRKIELSFLKVCWCCLLKIIFFKLVRTCQNYSLTKLVHFLDTGYVTHRSSSSSFICSKHN